MKKSPLHFFFLTIACILLPWSVVDGQNHISVSYGSTFEGTTVSLFGTSDGQLFGGSNSGLIALGYFPASFNVETAASEKDKDALLANFYVLDSSDFSNPPVPGYFTTGNSLVLADDAVGRSPYILVFGESQNF